MSEYKENNKVIDSDAQRHMERSVVADMILWWEKRRIIYNVILIGFSIFLMDAFWDYPLRKIVGTRQIILDAIYFVIGMNICYSIFWIFGVVGYFMFKSHGLSNRARWVTFVVGTLFSIVITNLFFVFAFDVLFAD